MPFGKANQHLWWESIRVGGMPKSVPDRESATFVRSLQTEAGRLISEHSLKRLDVQIQWQDPKSPPPVADNGQKQEEVYSGRRQSPLQDLEARAKIFNAAAPSYSIDRLVVPDKTMALLSDALAFHEVERRVFDDWGLRQIEPFPKFALNFHGPPGTGKTLAAHALAKTLQKKILVASFADLESKYPGDSQKNLRALFLAADRDNALLMIDEAETLLSKRISNVTQGAEHSLNAMRSELILAMESFKGIIVFATNLFGTYDPAFLSRLRHIEFSLPDVEARRKIWALHLPDSLPRDAGVSIDELAKVEGVSGRSIKNSVVNAAIRAAREGRDKLQHQDFLDTLTAMWQAEESARPNGTARDLTDEERQAAVETLKKNHSASRPNSS